MSRLDDLLSQQATGSPPNEQTLEHLKAALGQPRHPWRRDAARLAVTLFLAALGLTAVLLASGNASPALVASRVSTVLPLLVLGAAGAWLSLMPGGAASRLAVVVAAGLAMIGVVALRGVGHPGSQPEWVCTLTHLALGLGPLVLALTLLRRAAADTLRAIVAGVSVGTVGAIAGEVGCDQGWQHVLWFHLTPWLVLTVVAVIVSPRLKRWSFAP